MAKRNVVTEKTFCNRCGKRFDMWDDLNGFEAEARLGFGSKYDGEILELDLCCACMDALIDECRISPLVDSEAPADE